MSKEGWKHSYDAKTKKEKIRYSFLWRVDGRRGCWLNTESKLVEWGSSTENLNNERTCFKWHAKMAARLLQAASMTSVARQSHYPSSAYVLAWSLRDCLSAYTAPARMGHKFYIYMYNTCSFSWPFRAPACFFWSLTLNFGLSVYNTLISRDGTT